jgi:hypothetical protein
MLAVVIIIIVALVAFSGTALEQLLERWSKK